MRLFAFCTIRPPVAEDDAFAAAKEPAANAPCAGGEEEDDDGDMDDGGGGDDPEDVEVGGEGRRGCLGAAPVFDSGVRAAASAMPDDSVGSCDDSEVNLVAVGVDFEAAMEDDP